MKLRQLALDTETTGIDPRTGHRIIEIAAIELVDRRFTGESFHVYINPERDIDQKAEEIHGISLAFLADKPKFSDVFNDFFKFIDGAQLIIHNAPFDTGFINHEFKRHDRKLKSVEHYCSVVDTLAMARKLHPGQKNSLDALCKRYRVDNSKRVLHGALVDADLLARVYLAMTGGQASLLPVHEDKSTTPVYTIQTTTDLPKETTDLPVLYADATELVLHQQKLAAIQHQAGQVVWPSEETVGEAC